MTTLRSLVLACASALTVVACGTPFEVKTAPGFVALEDQTTYAYRATSPEGVVMAVRVVDDENRGDISFWTQAVTLRLRDSSGYALLDASDVTSRDGTKGRLLRFGHDQDGRPFSYWVAIYLAQGRLFLVDAGGAEEPFARARPNIEWMMKSVEVRCHSALAPVLASRTCNKW